MTSEVQMAMIKKKLEDDQAIATMNARNNATLEERQRLAAEQNHQRWLDKQTQNKEAYEKTQMENKQFEEQERLMAEQQQQKMFEEMQRQNELFFAQQKQNETMMT